MKLRLGCSIIPLCFLLLFVTGCHSYNSGKKAYYTFSDSIGHEVVLTKKPMRVVALLGSFAEVAILSGMNVVGVTEDAASERGIDVSGMVVVGGVKSPNIELILSLQADFILLSTDISSHLKMSAMLTGIAHAYFKVEEFSQYLDMLNIFCKITNRDDLYVLHGENIAKQIEESKQRCAKKVAGNILLLRAYSSGVKAKNSDNVAGGVLSDLGCINIADSENSLLQDLSLEIIIMKDPKYIFVTTMGSDSAAAIASFEKMLRDNSAWGSLTAIKENRIEFLPKELFHYKPNNRWGESYEYIEKILFP